MSDIKKFLNDKGVSSTTLLDYNKHVSQYITPTILEERNLNVVTMDVFSRLMYDRVIYIIGEINEDIAPIITGQLLYLSRNQPKLNNTSDVINIYINSPGGSVIQGLSIIDTIEYVDCPIYTMGMGICASMAAVLLACGTEGKRAALPNTQIMIHELSTGISGKYGDVVSNFAHTQKLNDVLLNMLSEKTGQTKEKIKEDWRTDMWMTTEEAKEYGLIDMVIKKQSSL